LSTGPIDYGLHVLLRIPNASFISISESSELMG
jgi:hypothetical protein